MPGKVRKVKGGAAGPQPSKKARKVKKQCGGRRESESDGRAPVEGGATDAGGAQGEEEAAGRRKASADAALDALSAVEALFAGKVATLREALQASMCSAGPEVAVPAEALAALRRAVADLGVVSDGEVSCRLCDQAVRRSSMRGCSGCKQNVCPACAAAGCIVCSVKAEKAALPKAASKGILVPDAAQARRPYRLAAAAAYNAIGEAWTKLDNNVEALRLHTKARAFREELAPNSPDVAETYANIGRVYYDRDEHAEALRWYSRSRQIREDKDPGSLALAKTILHIGCVFVHQGKAAEALACYKTSAHICEEKGPDSSDLVGAYTNIGNVYLDGENYAEALEWFNKARLICEKKPEKGLEAAGVYYAIGLVHYEQEAFDEALRWCKKACKIERGKAPNSLALATTYYKIGAVYQKQEEYDKALVALHTARQLRAENAPDSLDVAVTCQKIGSVWHDQGEFDTVLDWYRKACVIREQKEPEGLDLAQLYYDIGYVYYEDLENYDEALVWYKKACVVEEKAAPNSLDLATTYFELGLVCYDLEDEKGALSSFHRSRVIREEKAPDSLELAEAYCYIGRTYYHWARKGKGDGETARGWLHRAQEIAEKKVSIKEYRVILDVYDYLGSVYNDQEKYVEALAWHNKALLFREKATPLSGSIPITYDAIAGVYYNQNELDKALECYEKAARLHGENKSRAKTYTQMGYVYDDQGKRDEAVASYHKARVILENDAQSSLELGETYHCLGRAYFDLGKYDEALHWHIHSCQVRESKRWEPGLDLAKTYFRIGDVHAAQDKHDEALDWYKRSLTTCEKAPNSHLADLYCSIGLAHYAEERYDDALAWFNKSHPIHKRTANAAIVYYHIGRVYNKQGDVDVALEWFTKARLIEEEEVPGSLDVAQTYNKIGCVYREKGDYDQALEWFNEERVIREEEEPESLDLEWTHQVIREVRALLANRCHGQGVSSGKEPRPQMSLPQLPMDDYEPLGKEGFGSSGEVTTWRHTTTAVRVAVKKFKQQKEAFFDREVDALSQMQGRKEKSPFVVAMLSHGQVRGRPAIRLECCDGDLRARIVRLKQEKRQFSNGEIRAFGRGLLAGLQHVHSVGLLHRDVKPSNVLLATEGETEVVKLCDFGWAIAAKASDRTQSGTSAYNAPEVGHLDYTAASDMFSFGVTLYELITLEVKLHDRYIAPQLRELRDRTSIDDALLQTTERVSWELSTACLSCLQAVPRRRPTADPAILGVELAECKRDTHVGAGAFGDVFAYNWQWTPLLAQPKRVAVKMMHEAEYERTMTEVRMLSKANQRSETSHIVGVLGHGIHIDTFSGRDLEYIIMPYCDQGTLAAKIATRTRATPFQREEVVGFAVAILSGLSVAHANRVVHRDLKPENILFIRENGRDVLKLSDFGLSATTSRSRYTGNLGTGAYMAPELLRDDGVRYHSEVDMFAFGVVLYELCTLEDRLAGQTLGALLLSGNKQLGRIAEQLSQREHDIVAVVTGCLNCDGTQRPDAGVCSERLGHSVDTVSAEDYIKVGSAVVAMNLAEMQELNGQSGQVVQILEDNKVAVQFEGVRGQKVLDRSNVKQVHAPA